MSAPLRFFELPPSPNSMKVRIALRFKQLDFEVVPVHFRGMDRIAEDRAEVVASSTQPLTPVLEHEGRAIWDSAAILRYLDSAFPETPRLFSSDYGEMRTIEQWELHAKTELGACVTGALNEFLSGKPDPTAIAALNRRFHEVSGLFERRLSESSWLAGDRMTAADVSTAPHMFYGAVPAELAEVSPMTRLYYEHITIGPDRPHTRAWIGQVMAYVHNPAPAAD